ncbi:DNA polymerase beta superfamily protein [Pelagicoccus mobilis]|uniref:Nucleotidyltransferase domain-containing protein n=1 Tax=Pelagicoccus mobilis TaxID=415221 RepID=A0A934S0V7_9BACT|nr:nucleotidyltransferase domain-containing protein [Pelagicoccus mobilis]MBK1879868.1 nucleotidyltransferase domain-containing protein [Pelagicoccus mobilis]
MPKPLTIEDLRGDSRSPIIFESIVGSQAYGTSLESSDVDIKGIFVLPAADYLSLHEVPPQISDAKGDTVYYALPRFLELVLGANPNIIELLFMPEECISVQTPAFDLLQKSRSLFVTQKAYESHIGYALAQIKKAKGQNKWVNNPQPKERPNIEDFCWFIPRDDKDQMPYRPKTLTESGINLKHCHVAALEHSPSMYRLYHYGPQARGVFRGGKLACEPILIEDEMTKCIGLLSVNEQAHDRAVRDHANYWTWRENRNEARWESQEKGETDYDAKNMMHTFRLLLSGKSILKTGEPRVRFEGDDQQFLLDIRQGKFAYNDLITHAEQLVEELTTLKAQSTLPEELDFEKAEALLKEVTNTWESSFNHR